MRIRGTGPFKTLILPYHKGRKRNDLQVTQDGDKVIIATASETTVVADGFYAYTSASKQALSTFDVSLSGANGLSVAGGPAEIVVQADRATITAHGAKGLRRLKLPGNWTPVAPLSFQNGEYLLDYASGEPVQVILSKQPPEPAPPGADSFAAPAVVAGPRVQVRVANASASKETGEPNHAGYRGGKSVWWSWTAPGSGTAKISTHGSTFDSVLAVYTGSALANLTLLAANDDAASGTNTSEVSFTAETGRSYFIAVDGFDGAAGTIALDVALTVAPALAEISAQRIDEGQPLTITNRVLSAETFPGQPVFSFSLEPGGPAGAMIDPATGVFSWTPTEEQGGGAYPTTVRVTKAGLPAWSDAKTFTVTVNEVNRAPVLAAMANQASELGRELIVSARATDEDKPANDLTYSLDSNAPPGVTIDPATGIIKWTPVPAQGLGTFPITVRLTESGSPPLSDSKTFTITVTEVRRLPVLSAVPDQVVKEGEKLFLTMTATINGAPALDVFFALAPGAPEGATIDPILGELYWTPKEAQGPGVYRVSVVLTDFAAWPVTEAKPFTVTVNEVNQAPVLPRETAANRQTSSLRHMPRSAHAPRSVEIGRAKT